MKQKTIHICKNCGFESPRWIGKCPSCEEWNSFDEDTINVKKIALAKNTSNRSNSNHIVALKEISTDKEYRIKTQISELDRVLGGGIIPGSLVLVGGDPGIGKSTLMLQLCSNIKHCNPLYITGEESLQQIKYRSLRIENINNDLLLLAETNAETINSTIKSTDSSVIIIDSIQSIYSDMIDATPGSITQVRECAMMFMQTAKSTNKAIFLIGHINKEGSIAGPKILEHLVDTVVQFEGEKQYIYRILRCFKNRFGSTNEIGVFEMTDKGLNEVINPSEVFLSGVNRDESGVAIVATMEGARPILLEVQALVTPTNYGIPQRSATGFPLRRLQMILAVLEKRIGLQFSANDVFINIAGGMNLDDTACDLGIAAALVSSLRDMPINTKTCLIGEIGLTGEVRTVTSLEQRISEVEKLGFDSIVLPAGGMQKISKKFTINMKGINKITSLLSEFF